MEHLLKSLYSQEATRSETLGLLLVSRSVPYSPLTDEFDYILLIVTEGLSKKWNVKHMEAKQKTIAIHYVEYYQLEEWLLVGSHRRVAEWVMNGTVLYDERGTMAYFKSMIQETPEWERKKRIGIEFAKLVRWFSEGKALFQAEHYLDAFNYMLQALHHLGRLTVMEKGYQPEVTVWKQVEHIAPQIYKLYVELVTSEDSLEKRIQLLLLANDFSLSRKLESGTAHILDVMHTKKDFWEYEELMHHPALLPYGVDLSSLIGYLVQRGYIEIERVASEHENLYHLLYRPVKK